MKSMKKYFLASFSLLFLFMVQTNIYTAYAKEESHKDHKQEHGHDVHDEERREDSHEEEVINLDDEAQSMIQLKTENAQMKKLGRRLKVYGKIAKDTENYSYITFDGEGRVEKIYVGLGAIVDKGDTLLDIKKSDGSVKKVDSQIHGTILSVFVKTGDRIDRLSSLLSIINVDTLRATIDIYEKDLRFVEVGQEVILVTAAFPDKEFHGKIVYISPQLDEHTQAIKVRVDVDNSEHLLRLGMFVSGELIISSDKEVLAVPKEAVQQLNGENIVFVAEDKNTFRIREVILGTTTDDHVEIKNGLQKEEKVVTQGSFYLKSEQAKESFGDGHGH